MKVESAKKPAECPELSDKQRMLLMAYHDRECGAWACWRAKRLLSRSTDAAEFFAILGDVSSSIKSVVDATTPELKGSLWEAVSSRIDQEERAALYLGARIKTQNIRPRFSFAAPLGWSMAGGLVAACFTFVVISKMQGLESFSPALMRDTRMAKSSIDSVGYAPTNDDLPKLLESRDTRGSEPLSFASTSVDKPLIGADGRALQNRVIQNSVDVDWVRSAGAVRFFSDPNQHSTMIWVRKRAPRVQVYSASPVTAVTPNVVAQQKSFGLDLNFDHSCEGDSLSCDGPRFVEQPFSHTFSFEDR